MSNLRGKVVLVGGGGHCKVIIDAIINAGEYDIEGIVDSKLNIGDKVLGIPVIGNDDILPMVFEKGVKNAFIGVGSVGDCTLRKKLSGKLKSIGFNLPVVIHTKAVVAQDVRVGEGTFIAASATINPGTVIGRNAIINTSSSIDHDCHIADFVHVAPGATLSGGVKIGEGTHIGTGAKVIQYLNIGKNCMIKANSLVSRNVADSQTIGSGVCVEDGQSNKKVFIIAEAGVNHNGDVGIAKQMIDIAREAGADAVKFQTFKAEKLVTKFTTKAEYQKKTTAEDESQLEMLKRLELSLDEHKELFDYCRKKNIMFLSSPFDSESIDLLCSLGLEIFKIPSGEITNLPFLKKLGSLAKKVILSTGMADSNEVKNAIDVLEKAGTRKDCITILHCTSEYPAPLEEVNLRAIKTLKRSFGLAVGYSDHTLGIEASIAAVAMGACVIEKHFTVDRNLAGPDHKASLEPAELKAMVEAIRNIEKALGDGIKVSALSELKNKAVSRKSIVASRKIKQGDTFAEENITVKRPGIGISPGQWENIIGKKAKKNFRKDELIET